VEGLLGMVRVDSCLVGGEEAQRCAGIASSARSMRHVRCQRLSAAASQRGAGGWIHKFGLLWGQGRVYFDACD
jgi:hypothetical protein